MLELEIVDRVGVLTFPELELGFVKGCLEKVKYFVVQVGARFIIKRGLESLLCC